MFYLLINDLVNVLHHDGYLNVILDNTLQNNNFTDYERRLYTKLIYGVTEKKLYLDYVSSDLLKGKRVKPFIKCAIRIGIYSCLFLDVKDYFIVNSIVDAVKKEDYKGSMFVNAILRTFIRDGGKKLDNLSKIEKLSLNISLPLDLTKYLYEQYEEDFKFFFTPSVSYNIYRINLLKTSIDNIKEELDKLNILYELQDNVIYTKQSLINIGLFKEGLIIAQDSSSMIPATFIEPSLDDVILDACAAPGGKSLYMAELSHDKAIIYSCDIYEEKLKKINDNQKRLGINCIKTLLADATNYDYNMEFNKILVDAPCSGLGTINHKPDLKYHITLNDIEDIIKLQESILNHTCKYLKSGGVLVYSTCTINRNENELQIEKFLKNHSDFKKIKESIVLPSEYGDGFYICKLIKE